MSSPIVSLQTHVKGRKDNDQTNAPSQETEPHVCFLEIGKKHRPQKPLIPRELWEIEQRRLSFAC